MKKRAAAPIRIKEKRVGRAFIAEAPSRWFWAAVIGALLAACGLAKLALLWRAWVAGGS